MAEQLLAIDYGDVRVGLALADAQIKIAVPYGVLINDEQLLTNLAKLILDHQVSRIVVGYPRNQAGEATAQTAKVEAFVEQLRAIKGDIVFQDESLTSVLAEQRLKSFKKNYNKEDIDAHAAAIILEDYLEGR